MFGKVAGCHGFVHVTAHDEDASPDSFFLALPARFHVRSDAMHCALGLFGIGP